MKIVSHQSLSNKFSDVIKETQAVQLEFKSAVKEKLARQAKIYDNKLTPEEVEEIINSPEGMANLIQSKMVGGANSKMMNAVSDIQDKYKDIIKLERSVEVMHQMFVDMSLLVHANGELINSIEANVNDSKDYVAKAVVKLSTAKQDHQTAKKLYWCLMAMCLIIMLVCGVMFGFF